MVRKRGSLDFCFSSSYFYAYPFLSCSYVSSSCGVLSAVEMVSCLGWELFVPYWYSAKGNRTQFLMGFIGFFGNTNLWFWLMVHWLTHFGPPHCLIRQSVVQTVTTFTWEEGGAVPWLWSDPSEGCKTGLWLRGWEFGSLTIPKHHCDDFTWLVVKLFHKSATPWRFSKTP